MEYLFISIGILIILNVVVSFYLFNLDDLEQFQKVAQTIIVWLIPFVGAIGLWLFNRSQAVDTKQGKDSFGGGAPYEHTNGGD